jgi:hypothetical protein
MHVLFVVDSSFRLVLQIPLRDRLSFQRIFFYVLVSNVILLVYILVNAVVARQQKLQSATPGLSRTKNSAAPKPACSTQNWTASRRGSLRNVMKHKQDQFGEHVYRVLNGPLGARTFSSRVCVLLTNNSVCCNLVGIDAAPRTIRVARRQT